MRKPSGLTLILGATALSAVASYFLIWLVPQQIGLAAYQAFALFWAAMYFVVGTLSGLQQEVTRGTIARPVDAPPGASPARNFGLLAAGLVLVVVIASAPLWVGVVFPAEGWRLVWPLAFATSSYVLVATLAGTLNGIARWFSLAVMVSVDAVLRLVAVGIVASFTRDAAALAWAASIPFLLTIVLLWPGIRHHVVGRTALDVGYRALTWNVARTMVASASTGLLISGFPVVLGIAAVGESPVFVASLFLAITITRAPLIIVALSLQSYLIVRFRDHRESFWRDFLALQGLIAAAGVVVALAAWAWAPVVFDFLYGGEIDLDGWFYAVLVVSSALVGALCVTAPAVLARSQHFVYSAGWLAAAIVTVASFLLPFGLMGNTVTALLAGPIVGLAVHVGYLVSSRTSDAITRR